VAPQAEDSSEIGRGPIGTPTHSAPWGRSRTTPFELPRRLADHLVAVGERAFPLALTWLATHPVAWTRRVKAGSVWPNCRITDTGFSPIAKSSEAKVWRSECGVTPGGSDAWARSLCTSPPAWRGRPGAGHEEDVTAGNDKDKGEDDDFSDPRSRALPGCVTLRSRQ
jgi:hypothetical protein